MNEKVIRAVLPVIPTILLITCVVAAFAGQDWNVKGTIFGEENPLKKAEELLPFEPGAEPELLEDVDLKISEDRSKLIFEAVLHCPLNVPITIKEMSAEVLLDGNAVSISLPSAVEIPAKGSKRIKLEGSLADVEFPAQLSGEMPITNIRNMKMKLNISGIEVELEESGGGVG